MIDTEGTSHSKPAVRRDSPRAALPLVVSPGDRIMSRESRKQLLQLKPYLDKLETRRLMSLEAAKARFAHELAHEKTAMESQLAGGEIGDFALALAEHPRAAADLGLGALSQALRQHVGYAARHGWAASLVSELTSHPRYATAHHLMAAMNTPRSPAAQPRRLVDANDHNDGQRRLEPAAASRPRPSSVRSARHQ